MGDDCVLYPITTAVPCSGNGACVDGVCVCNAGWTGRADWARTDGLDCQVNEAVRYFLLSVLVATYVLVGTWFAPSVLRIVRSLRNKKGRDGRARKASLVENRAVVALVCRLCVAAPAATALGVIEISTDRRMGQDWLPTVVFLTLRTSLYFEAYMWYPYLMTQTVGTLGGRDTKALLRKNDLHAGLAFAAVIVNGFLVLVALAAGDPWVTVWTYCAFSIAVGFGFFALAAITHNIAREVGGVLESAYVFAKDPAILAVKTKLADMLKSSMRHVLVQGALNIVFGVTPYLLSKYTYVMPLVLSLPMLAEYARQVHVMAAGRQGSSSKATGTTTATNGNAVRQSPFSSSGARKAVLSRQTSDGPTSPFLRQTSIEMPPMPTALVDAALDEHDVAVVVRPSASPAPHGSPAASPAHRNSPSMRASAAAAAARAASSRSPTSKEADSRGSRVSHTSVTPRAMAMVNAARSPSATVVRIHNRFLFDAEDAEDAEGAQVERDKADDDAQARSR